MPTDTPHAADTNSEAPDHPNQQCEPQPFLRASSTLLSRLAEAADGHRMGMDVVYVAEFEYQPGKKGHEVHGPFEDCVKARYFRETTLQDPDGKKYGIFGPFSTRNGNAERPKLNPAVKHVIVCLEDGGSITINGKAADAIFWSRAAVEKFVIPYYVGIGTLEEGGTVLNTLDQGPIVAHRPGSEWRTESADISVNGEPLDPDPGLGSLLLKISTAGSGGESPDVTAVPLF